jgi:hypothetical protein
MTIQVSPRTRPWAARSCALFVLLLVLPLLSGCGGKGGSAGRGARVSVKGSDTMVILGQKWADT